MSRFNFLSPRYTEREVSGQKLRFYPLSLGLAFRLKTTLRPVIRAIAAFLQGDKGLSTQQFEQLKHPKEGIEQTKNQIQAISPEIYSARCQEHGRIIDEIVEAIFDPGNQPLLGEIIMDSLREECPKKPGQRYHDTSDVDEFIGKLDVVTLKDLLSGVLAANKELFGPLGKDLAEATRKQVERLRAASSPSSSALEKSSESESIDSEVPERSATAS